MRQKRRNPAYRNRSAGRRHRQRQHAIARCEQRYGIVLDIDRYLALCDRIWAASEGNEHPGVVPVAGFKKDMYFIWYQRTLMLVAWSERTKQIASFLSRADLIADKARIIAIRSTPIRLRWKLFKGGVIHGSLLREQPLA